MRRAALVLACALALPLPAGAFGSGSKGTAGAQFLKIAPSARAAAMGGAYGGVAEGVYAAYYNPAGLAFVDRVEAGASRDDHFQGITHDYGALAVPLLSLRDTRRKRGALGTAAFSVTSLSISDIERRGVVETDAPQGEFGASDFAYALSYGWAPRGRVAFGGTAKWIRQTLDDASASAFALDAGALARGGDWTWGGGVRHLGRGVKLGSVKDPLPTTLFAGAGWRPGPEWLVAGELRQPADDALLVSLGVEYARTVRKDLRGALRAGFDSANMDADGFGGATLGAGIRYRKTEFAFAWAPVGDLGSAFRYSLRIRF